MINEVFEAEQYLAGKNINKRCVYRMCYILAKYYLYQGFDVINTREKVFDWANNNGVYINSSLSAIVYKASVDGVKLRENVRVFVSKDDIKEIERRFDTKNTKMIALAFLCYGKVAAGSDGECSISCTSLANWIGIDYSHLMSRYLPQMSAFKYVSKVENKKRKWVKDSKSEISKFKYHVDLKNEGEFELKDNNLAELFATVFS